MILPISNKKRELVRAEYNKRFLVGNNYEMVMAKETVIRADISTLAAQRI
jgi:hypothetical protein